MPKLGHFSRTREAKLLVSFRFADGAAEHRAETISISPDCLLICSLIELNIGSPLAMKLQIPVELSGRDFAEVDLLGRVVCGCKLADGRFGYQIGIESRNLELESRS